MTQIDFSAAVLMSGLVAVFLALASPPEAGPAPGAGADTRAISEVRDTTAPIEDY